MADDNTSVTGGPSTNQEPHKPENDGFNKPSIGSRYPMGPGPPRGPRGGFGMRGPR